MQKASDAKTKSVHRSVHRRIAILLGSVIVIGVSVGIFLVRYSATDMLRVHGTTYHLLVVTSAAAQEKGLGDRQSLPDDEAMLFQFQGTAVRCFWMKDMHFSIDIVWLNAEKRIVYIAPNVSPATYPQTFCPSDPAQYVIEFNAGQASKAGLHVGQTLNF